VEICSQIDIRGEHSHAFAIDPGVAVALNEAASVRPSGCRYDSPGNGLFVRRPSSLTLTLRWELVSTALGCVRPFAAVLARARLPTEDRALTLVHDGTLPCP
jgi:hypothetical protein